VTGAERLNLDVHLDPWVADVPARARVGDGAA
jgi:hypothetical protein